MKVNNPILSGFYPDPSICRVGDEYYLVCSTFAYFPGVPIFKSKNLAEWTQIGNILDRNSQVPLEKSRHSGGIFAPTIRYHEGTFYMVTTNVSCGGNFIVTAKNPEGPWSEPYFLGAAGIDPSLYFEGDKCYYIGTRENSAGAKYYGDQEIWIQELDLKEMKLVGESHALWYGAMKNAIWAEGPHIYKIDDYYYILHAEGGTAFEHAISVARSKELFGPYEGDKKNPIFTHRHLGLSYPVQFVGHGDLVDDGHGNWFMVMLASRPCEGYNNLGRETFLAKVTWENGWPVVNPGIGVLEDQVETGIEVDADKVVGLSFEKEYYFTEDKLPFEMVTVRNPDENMFSLTENKGNLRLYGRNKTINEQDNASYIAIRQKHYEYMVECDMKVEGNSMEAGLVIMQNNSFHLRFTLNCQGDKKQLCVVLCEDGIETILATAALEEREVTLLIQAKNQKSTFSCVQKGQKKVLIEGVNTTSLSTEKAGGFVGCTIGMYATSKEEDKKPYADFSRFCYKA